MRRQSFNQGSGLKIVLYLLGVLLISGMLFLILQGNEVPTEHVSQKIEVSLEQ